MDLKFKDNNKLSFALFTQLEYIESTGTQYIDTGIKPVANDEFEVTYMITGTTGTYNSVFGTRVSFSSNAFMFGYKSGDSYIEFGNQNITSFNKGYSQNIKHTIKLENGNLYVDDVFDRSIVINQNTVHNLLLFTLNDNGGPGEFGKCKIYNFIIKRAGVKVLELIPASNYNGLCFYDTVSKTFFYNQGTGNFIAGPEVPSIIGLLPSDILLKTTSLYHENTPKVSFIYTVFSILNYQKNHQEEIKEYYYPTTQLWQDIITEYPDIVQYYNMNHKLCVVICEADDPEQCAEDFLAVADDIQQELEDYPSLIPIIAEYPSLIPIIAEYPSLIPIIAEYPALASIIAENPEVVHSLIDTGYETWLQADGSSWLTTNYYINGNTDVECRACFLIYDVNASPMLYGGAPSYKGVGGEMYGWTDFTFVYYYTEVTFTTSQVPINVKFKAKTTAGLINITLDNGTSLTGGSTSRLTFTSTVPTVVFALNRGMVDFKSATSKLSSLKFKEGVVDKLWLVPIQNNGNPCMIDLLTGTKYLNQGTGSFTYSLEPKNS